MLLELQYHLHRFIVLLKCRIVLHGKDAFQRASFFFSILKLGTLKATVDRKKCREIRQKCSSCLCTRSTG